MVDPVQAVTSTPDTLLQLTLLRPLEVRFVVSSWVTGAFLLFFFTDYLARNPIPQPVPEVRNRSGRSWHRH